MQAYQRELLKDLTTYASKRIEIDDFIITCDFNKDVYLKEIEKFVIENSLFNVHKVLNEIDKNKRNSTYIYSSKYIDIITTISGLLHYIEGCKVSDFNELILTNY